MPSLNKRVMNPKEIMEDSTARTAYMQIGS
jgi:hypothetical protein